MKFRTFKTASFNNSWLSLMSFINQNVEIWGLFNTDLLDVEAEITQEVKRISNKNMTDRRKYGFDVVMKVFKDGIRLYQLKASPEDSDLLKIEIYRTQ